MKKKLTPGGVKNLPLPETGKVIYWDTQLPGFGVRAVPSGKSYVVRTRVGGGRQGRDVIHTIGRCNELALPAARTKAMDALSRLRSGTDLVKEKALKAKQRKVRGITLMQLFNEYISRRDLRPRTKQTYADALRLCIPDWSDQPITGITRDMIEKRLQTITDEPGVRGNRKAQAAQCFTLLRALFRFAADRYEVDGKPVIGVIPTKNIAKGKSWSKVSTRDNIIAESNLKAWYQATVNVGEDIKDDDDTITRKGDPVLRDYIQFLAFSGMRRTECLRLKWTDIDSKNKVLTIRAENAKTGKKRLIPLTDLLITILEKRHSAPTLTTYVFPGRKPGTHLVEPRRAAELVRKDTKIDFAFHDLRRTYITFASKLVPYAVLKALVGHTTGSAGNDVTQRHYLRLDMESLKPEAQKVADWFKAKCAMDLPAISQSQTEAAK